MNEILVILGGFLSVLLFNFLVGFYFITALQWYNYKIERVLFHFHKKHWHLLFFVLPCVIFLLSNKIFLIYALFFGSAFLAFWYKKLDKKLVFTAKIRVFFYFLAFFSILCAFLDFWGDFRFRIGFLGFVLALIALKFYSIYKDRFFYQKAQNKLVSMNELKIILITASFGKTSIKNFLFHLLSVKFKVQMTPRSVNTLLGVVKDINENLNKSTQIYIVEAGARQRGDIAQITALVKPHIVIVGEIGSSHLEYFKSEENIRTTKLEALQSSNLQRAFLHSSTKLNENSKFVIYDKAITHNKATLEGLEFSLNLQGKEQEFKANLLGSFNTQNLSACILCALFLGLNEEQIKTQISSLKSVEHRLQIIAKEPKFIIDDGFNGNFKGMSASYELCKTYTGRKVLVTPGIIEVGESENVKLIEKVNECFDFVIVIGSVNAALFEKNLRLSYELVGDKTKLVEFLAQNTRAGDLILFSNDTPSFL